jgi:hypothetical protein
MLVWNVLDARGGWIGGVIAAALFGLLAIALWRARGRFQQAAAIPSGAD